MSWLRLHLRFMMAFSCLSNWRSKEGEELSEDISARLDYMEEAAKGFEAAAPEIERAYRKEAYGEVNGAYW